MTPKPLKIGKIVRIIIVVAIGAAIIIIPSIIQSVTGGLSEPKLVYPNDDTFGDNPDFKINESTVPSTFEIKDFGFQFEVPPQWATSELKPDYNSKQGAKFPLEVVRVSYLPGKFSMELFAVKYPFVAPLGDFEKGFVADIEKNGGIVSSLKQININGNPGYQYVVSDKSTRVKTFFSHENFVYMWTYDLEPKETNSSYADRIISTFKFTN